jgi:hypothetical protein
MASSRQSEVKMKAKHILRPKIYLREVIMKYGSLFVLIRHDSAEIWGFRYGLTLVIGTQKIMASTGVFVRVVCALNHSTNNFPCSPCIILT